MRTVYMIALLILSFGASAMAEGWNFNFRGRVIPQINTAPQAGTVEASTTIDGPAAAPAPEAIPAPVEVAPAQAPMAADYGYGNGGNGGCGCGKGNGGYFNQSWFGGCCEQQNSCCAGIWDNYCSQRKSWCNHGCHKQHCCQPACEPACQRAHECSLSWGGCGAWMNRGPMYGSRFNPAGWNNGSNNGCSNCGHGNGDATYGKQVMGDELPSEIAPAAEPTPAPAPEVKPELKPIPNPPKPMAREAFRPYFPSLRMMPTSFGF